MVKLGVGLTIGGTALVESAAARDRTHAFGQDARGWRDYDLVRSNPVLFWNDVSIQLVALDHSVDRMQSRAPGPCASARALGLVHIVIADAVAAVYATDFEGLFVRRSFPILEHRDHFVGGAAASILRFIFDSDVHQQLIASAEGRFLKGLGDSGAAASAWRTGYSFARDPVFTSHWDGEGMRRLVIPTDQARPPGPRGHEVDPFNPSQGYYGVHWSRVSPLDPWFGNVTQYTPPPPPSEHDAEYRRDFEEVRVLGEYRHRRPTVEQVKVGLFWAYDGARLIGTPPRLYNQIVRKVAEHDGMPVAVMARLFALCNLAMADAGIACWEAKYRYDLWRPVVALRHSLRGADRDWRPFGSPRTNPEQFAKGENLGRPTAQSFMGADHRSRGGRAAKVLDYQFAAFTPNFPSYPSGHAMFGAACLTMLKLVRAEQERTHFDPGRISPAIDLVSDELNGLSVDNFVNRPRPYVPLNYTSIDQMIVDNNRSRVHLGLHWNFDCVEGAKSGVHVANRIHSDAYLPLGRHAVSRF